MSPRSSLVRNILSEYHELRLEFGSVGPEPYRHVSQRTASRRAYQASLLVVSLYHRLPFTRRLKPQLRMDGFDEDEIAR